MAQNYHVYFNISSFVENFNENTHVETIGENSPLD